MAAWPSNMPPSSMTKESQIISAVDPTPVLDDDLAASNFSLHRPGDNEHIVGFNQPGDLGILTDY